MAFKGIDFVPHGTKIPFVSARNLCMLVSGALMLASLVLFGFSGLNYGIDFRGGTLVEIKSASGQIDISQIRAKLDGLGLGDVQIQQIEELSSERDCFGGKCALIRVEQQEGGEKAQQKVVVSVRGALGEDVIYRRTEVVGPTVSEELKQSGTIAVITAILAVLMYIWFRFEWQFSVGAVAALIHDVVLTIGIFTLLQLEFNLSIIAALLTIVGYSLNDTVVVYDRVRENLRRYKKMPLTELLDLSINQTLSRTVLTSATTLMALLALFFFGTDVIRGFTFAMIWGVLVGTYSSIFIASPVLLMLGVKRDWSGLGGPKIKQPAAGKA